MADNRYRLVDTPTTDGAGRGYKVEKVAPPPPLEGSTFGNMQTVSDLQTCCAMNPEAGFHNVVTRTIVAHGKVRDQQRQMARDMDIDDEPNALDAPNFELPNPVRSKPKPAITASRKAFGRGMSVKDKSNNRKGIIIQANAGYTKKTRINVHRVCDSKGKAWLALETDLREI